MEEPDIEVLSDPQSLRGSYLAALGTFLDRVRSTCIDDRVDYALIGTNDPLDVALATLLSTRMHRMRAS